MRRFMLLSALLLSCATSGRAEEEYLLRGGTLYDPSYHLPRSVIGRQPKWQAGQPLPVPLAKLSRIALDRGIPDDNPDRKEWRVASITFMPVTNGSFIRKAVETNAIPEDLRDRWFCLFLLDGPKDHRGEWSKWHQEAVVLLDGTFVPQIPAALSADHR